MASIGDLLCRTDYLLEKYGKYNTPLEDFPLESGGFDDEVRLLQRDIRNLSTQANEVAEIKNRATVAAKNAEIRRGKNHILQNRLPELDKKLRKGKNVTPSLISQRQVILEELANATRAIPDGIRVHGQGKPGSPSSSRPGGSAYTRLEGPGALRPEEYRHTEETLQFEQDWEESKRKQDEALDRIEKGVGILGNLAKDMNQEVQLQNPVLDAMEAQLDRVTGDVKTRNQQLRHVLQNMGSRTNICMNIVLIVILLALAAYIYSLVT